MKKKQHSPEKIKEKIESNLAEVNEPDRKMLELLFRDVKVSKHLTKGQVKAAAIKNYIWDIALCWFINLEYSSELKVPYPPELRKPVKPKGQALQAMYNAGLKIHANRKFIEVEYPKILDEIEASEWIFCTFAEWRQLELVDTETVKISQTGKYKRNFAEKNKTYIARNKQFTRTLRGKEKWGHSTHPENIINPLKREDWSNGFDSMTFWFWELGCAWARKSDRFRKKEWKKCIEALEKQTDTIKEYYTYLWVEGDRVYKRAGKNGRIEL